MRIVFWVFYILTIIGLIFSVVLVIQGSLPCSGDGCMIQLLYIIGIPLLIIFGLLFFFMTKIIVKQWKSKS